MADDIIPLRHSYALSMVERISDLTAEVKRLRAAGDAMAEALDALCDWHCGNKADADLVDAWREARRG